MKNNLMFNIIVFVLSGLLAGCAAPATKRIIPDAMQVKLGDMTQFTSKNEYFIMKRTGRHCLAINCTCIRMALQLKCTKF